MWFHGRGGWSSIAAAAGPQLHVPWPGKGRVEEPLLSFDQDARPEHVALVVFTLDKDHIHPADALVFYGTRNAFFALSLGGF